jgi:XTP/dITP diphosphohydrolase
MAPLLIATTNRGKIREIETILTGVPFELSTLASFPQFLPPAETGATFAENARAKALYYAGAAGVLTVAEDSGLQIDALGGAPGVESARFGGINTSYEARFALLYDALGDRRSRHPGARFVCALALAHRGAILFEAAGVVAGEIAPEPRGASGFGYDPIFFYPPFGCTFAEAGGRKDAVSHRGRAFRALREFLNGDTPEVA